MNRILTFGTFDGIHDGHRAMLRQAKNLTTGYLIVAVATDTVVKELKAALPKYSSAQRIAALKNEHLADEVVSGDDTLHSWNSIKKYKPNIIALGYDQAELRAALEEYLEGAYPDIETEAGFQSNPKKPTIVILRPYKPETYHSSLLK